MIDEKKLIEDFKNTFSDSVLNQTFGFGKYTLLEAVVEMINRQPKKDCSECTRRKFYQQGYKDGLNADKWIPCEERLPKALEDVLVWCKGIFKSGTNVGEECQWYGLGYHCNGIWEVFQMKDIKNIKVVAWQPLPTPYKKEGAENE